MICSNKFSLLRHLKKHESKDELQRCSLEGRKKKLKCPDPDCSKTFYYPSKVQNHYKLKHGFQYADFVCFVDECGKRFPNAAALHDHSRTSHCSHSHNCHICGSTFSSGKCLKQHLQRHDNNKIKKRLFCPYDGCTRSYANSSNLTVHIKVFHMGIKQYQCTIDDCGKTFSHRHSRDNHEKCGVHVQSEGDFVEEDMRFCSRPRGGRKPATIHKIEDLYEKKSNFS